MCSCAKHTIFQCASDMADTLRRTAQNLLNLVADPLRLLPIGTFSIALASLFVAIDTFSPTPSLQVKIGSVPGPHIEMNRFWDFYQEHSIEAPAGLVKILPKPTKEPSGYFSDHAQLFHLLSSPETHPYLEGMITGFGIPDMEARLLHGKLARDNQMWGNESLLPEERCGPVLAKLKTLLSVREYYVLLLAFMQARLYMQYAHLKNNSPVELRDIRVFIPAALNETEEDARSDIAEVTSESRRLVASLSWDKDQIALSIPRLKPGETFSFRFVSYGYPVSDEHVVSNFTAARQIDRRRAVITLLLAFFVTIVFVCFLHQPNRVLSGHG